MQPSRGCIVKKTEGGAFSAEDGTGADARPSASRTAGRTSAPPGRGQAAKAVFRRRGMARIRRMRGAPQAGRAARWQARTPPERPNAPAPTARDFAPLPTHRCGRGRSAKRTRPKPICRLASAADASETAPDARSERLGRSHAHVREERRRLMGQESPRRPSALCLQGPNYFHVQNWQTTRTCFHLNGENK